MVVNGKYDSNTNLVDAMEPTALDDEKKRPKFHKSSSMATQASIVGTRVAMENIARVQNCPKITIIRLFASFGQMSEGSHVMKWLELVSDLKT